MTNRLADYAASGLSVRPAVRSIKKLLLYSTTIILILQPTHATRAWIVETPSPSPSPPPPPPPPPSPVAGSSAARRHDSAFAGFPHDTVQWPRRPGRPVDVTTDAINDLGIKILDRYVQHQRGNVAFSPSGLGFVLVALYEGAAGSSAREISEVLGLPRDRRLTRIGLRDIHRRLRSYLNADAFLGGLTLNREDINLREDYERILRFYGFDISDSAMENNETTSLSGNATDSPNENPADEVETLPSPKLTSAVTTVTADSGTTASSSPLTVVPTTSPVTVVPTASTVTDAPPTTSSSSPTTVAPTTTDAPTTVSNDPTVIDAPTRGTPSTNDTVATTTSTLAAATVPGDTVTTNLPRRRRGIFHGPLGYFSASPPEDVAAAAAAAAVWLDEEEYGRLNDNEDYPSDEGDRGDSRRSTEIVFLVNGCDYSRVTGATYTAFLPFSHFASLRASLLEFPLDDPRYKILVMLPSEATNGTRDLARTLATRPITLRKLRASLGATWLTAVVPSFMLRGFVTLTPYLQRLGISDVFDPRAADLTPMSPDLGVYARDVQQSIGLNIRNTGKSGNGGAGRGIGGADGGDEERRPRTRQRDSDKDGSLRTTLLAPPPPFFLTGGPILPRFRANLPYPSYSGPPYERATPVVPFVVDRPFLYFIVDDETSVTLLAGRIDDPLNSRVL